MESQDIKSVFLRYTICIVCVYPLMSMMAMGYSYLSKSFDGITTNSKRELKNYLITVVIMGSLFSLCIILLSLIFIQLSVALVSNFLSVINVVNYVVVYNFLFNTARFDDTKKLSFEDRTSAGNIIIAVLSISLMVFFMFLTDNIVHEGYMLFINFIFLLLTPFWINYVSHKVYDKRYKLMQGFRGQ